MANVDAYEVVVTPQYEIVEPAREQSSQLPIVATVVGSPVVWYIMQANDSVTGVRYDWLWPNVPDLAGAGYNGPNLPTNIAIAGQNP